MKNYPASTPASPLRQTKTPSPSRVQTQTLHPRLPLPLLSTPPLPSSRLALALVPTPSPDSDSLLVCTGDYAYHSSSLLFRSTSSICKTTRLEIQNQMGALLIREFGLGDGREAGLRSRYPQPWYRLASTEGFALSLIACHPENWKRTCQSSKLVKMILLMEKVERIYLLRMRWHKGRQYRYPASAQLHQVAICKFRKFMRVIWLV